MSEPMATPDATTDTVRDRLAEILYDRNKLTGLSGDWPAVTGRCREAYLADIDAILAELENPSQPMVEHAAASIVTMPIEEVKTPHRVVRCVIPAMIQHIRNGGS